MGLIEIASLDELRQAVADLPRVVVQGGGSKPPLSHDAQLSLRRLSGVLQYEPSEYTFTALAGTPVAEVERMLAEHRQFLPFDPPLAARGATLGGVVASGVSGPGRLRYGGVRDFLLGVRMVTGEARVVFGGGKVVKNAAGFDIPKFVCGSLGQLGVFAELTFKVFPRPESYATLIHDLQDSGRATAVLEEVANSPLEPACLELAPPGRVEIRVGGLEAALDARIDRLRRMVGGGEVLRDDEDRRHWESVREFGWARGLEDSQATLWRIPLTSALIPQVERAWTGGDAAACRRYSVAGNVLWAVASQDNEWPAALTGRRRLPLLGAPVDGWTPSDSGPFYERLAAVFDPQGRTRRAAPSRPDGTPRS